MNRADDVGLGMIIKKSGGRSRLAVATDRLQVAWYRTTRSFLQGMEKGAAKAGGRAGLFIQSLLGVLLALATLSPFLLLGLWVMLPTPVAMIALAGSAWAIVTTSLVAIRFGLPLTWAFLLPVGILTASFVGQRALWLAIIRGGVRWRGDAHRLDVTREGETFRF